MKKTFLYVLCVFLFLTKNMGKMCFIGEDCCIGAQDMQFSTSHLHGSSKFNVRSIKSWLILFELDVLGNPHSAAGAWIGVCPCRLAPNWNLQIDAAVCQFVFFARENCLHLDWQIPICISNCIGKGQFVFCPGSTMWFQTIPIAKNQQIPGCSKTVHVHILVPCP